MNTFTNDTQTNVTINIVELASELADLELQKYFDYSAIAIWVEDEDETTYTAEAQDIFDEFYDKYYSIIESTKTQTTSNFNNPLTTM